MNKNTAIKMLCCLSLLVVLAPLFGQDVRNSPITAHIIVDGSAALGKVQPDISGWIASAVLDRLLQDGDRVAVWEAGGVARVIYSDTLNAAEKETITKAVNAIAGAGDTADFSGALREAVERTPKDGITYTVLISASSSGLATVLSGSQSSLLRYSRVEEFRGWRAFIVTAGIEKNVRQAASVWLPGT